VKPDSFTSADMRCGGGGGSVEWAGTFPLLIMTGIYAKNGKLWQVNQQRDKAQAAADADVDLATAEDTQAAGQQAAQRWNSAALAGARRRAGGSTYRHRGTTMSSAPSMLDKANIDAVAAARRKRAKANTELAYQDQQVTFQAAPVISLW